MNTLARLLAYVEEHPEDLTCRLVLADAYEDNGDSPRARYQRWVHDNRKYPERQPVARTVEVEYFWWASPGNRPADIHPSILWHTPNKKDYMAGGYTSVQEADEDLRLALEHVNYQGE